MKILFQKRYSVFRLITAPVLWIAVPFAALAKARCIVNGREVPCEQLFAQFEKFKFLGWVLLLSAAIPAVFWTIWLIRVSHKPRLDTMRQLHPKAVWLFFLRYAVGWVVFIIFAAIWFYAAQGAPALALTGLKWAGVFILLSVVNAYMLSRLEYHYFRYEVTDRGLHQVMGIISKKDVTIPFERIQNIDIHRSLLERILGLSDLQVQTAGYSGPAVVYTGRRGVPVSAGRMFSEGHLPGLLREEAEKIRNELLARAGQSKSQGV